MFDSAPPEIRDALEIGSGFRSVERQAELFNAAVQKYGSEAAARKWVAPPGKSMHNHGSAVDLAYVTPEARQWAHTNAGNFGLSFPMAHEPWHVELTDARGGRRGQPTVPPLPVAVGGNPSLAATALAPVGNNPDPLDLIGKASAGDSLGAMFADPAPAATTQQRAMAQAGPQNDARRQALLSLVGQAFSRG